MKLEDLHSSSYSFRYKINNDEKPFKLTLISRALDNTYRLTWNYIDGNSVSLKTLLEICVDIFEIEKIDANYIIVPYFDGFNPKEFTIRKTKDNELSDYYETVVRQLSLTNPGEV